jgi:isoamylase
MIFCGSALNETLIGGAGATYNQCGESLLLLISK